jgi:small RNA 2'-O-methyltransferase
VEHLPPAILPRFLPILLGHYRPRLLLLTTPNYEFNTLFTPPSVPDTEGYLDPTGETNRIFRHDDHKREWTVAEFTAWCESGAKEWGYEVEIGGVGKPVEADPWGRNDAAGLASQTAVFRRLDGWDVSRALPSEQLDNSGPPHELLASHVHAAHPPLERAHGGRAITDQIKLAMAIVGSGNVALGEIWYQSEVAIVCGGSLEKLFEAVAMEEGWQSESEGENVWRWRIIWSAFVEEEGSGWREKEVDDAWSMGSSEPDEFMSDEKAHEDTTDASVAILSEGAGWEAAENGWGVVGSASLAGWTTDQHGGRGGGW